MLALNQVVAGYGKLPLGRLDTLTVAPGEAAVLAGPSGSGKTTLLLAIAGLATLISGGVSLNDVDLGTLSGRERDRHRGRHIGLVFQDLHLFPGIDALGNVLLAPFASGAVQDKTRARELLAKLGLTSRISARAETLSRGEAQRVAIARAILIRPGLILADEPTASLDDAACDVVIDLLQDAAAEAGAALVIATHDSRVRARITNVATVQPA